MNLYIRALDLLERNPCTLNKGERMLLLEAERRIEEDTRYSELTLRRAFHAADMDERKTPSR